MKKFLWLLILMTPMALAAQTQVPPGPVSGTWDLSGSPYMVNGEIYIEEAETLTIEPGVEVKFTGWYKFIVYGSLMAEGTETNMILFTAQNPNVPWHGIRFTENESLSSLEYCIVENGRTLLNTNLYQLPDNAGGGIVLYDSPDAEITIRNSIIRDNQAGIGGGMEVINSTVTIQDCEIIQNTALVVGGMEFMDYSTGEVSGTSFFYNEATNGPIGGFSIHSNSHIEMSGCTISHNHAGSAGGIGVYYGSSGNFSDNIISENSCNNVGGGINILSPGPDGVLFNENLIVDNTAQYGAGVRLEDCQDYVNFSDNTIVYNTAGSSGGGISVKGNCSVSFTSDIIYFNENASGYNQITLVSSYPAVSLSYCDLQDGLNGIAGAGTVSLYEYCIEEDPLFVDPANDNYNLSWTDYPDTNNTMSPCIEKGCPGMFPAPDGSCNDIGAYDFFQQLDKPDMYPNSEKTHDSFLAEWTECYGAIGYYLDVALDDGFLNMVMSSIQIEDDTSFLVEGLNPDTWYYYRVKSYNYALTSNYSDIHSVLTLHDPQSINEMDLENIKLYTANHQIHIEIPKIRSCGDVYIYDLRGRLILNKSLNPGSNVIPLNIPNQIVVVRVLMEGRTNQQKLLIH